MPSATDFFSSKYMTGNDLPPYERRLTAVIISVTEETMQLSGETKLVLRLSTQAGRPWKKGVVLNVTNGKALVAACGDDYADWKDHRIEIWSEPTTFAGKPIKGIRLAVIGNGQSAPMPSAPEQREAGGGDLNDDVPFSPEMR